MKWNNMNFSHTQLYYKLLNLQSAHRKVGLALTDFEEQMAKDTAIKDLRPEHKNLGYTFSPISNSHDGLGDSYIQVKYRDEIVIGCDDRVSMSHRMWIEAFVQGHARAKGLI